MEAVEGLAVRLYREDDLDAALERSAVLTGFVIPAGFSERLRAGQPALLEVRQRGYGGEEGQVVAGIVRSVAEGLGGEAQIRALLEDVVGEGGAPRADVDAVVDRLLAEAAEHPPVGVRAPEGGDGGEVLNRMIPGIMVMFLLFAVTLNAQSMVEERRLGTLERLTATRLTAGQLFAGKFLAGVGRAVLQALVLLALAFVILRVGSVAAFAQVLLFTVLIATSVSALGLVIGAVARTRDQAIWMAALVTMFMSIFGGTFLDPGETGAFALLSRLTLNRYAIDALESILSGSGSLADQQAAALVMVGVAVVALVVARAAFRVSREGR